MSIRMLALALLASVSLAQAAPPKSPHKAPAKTEQPADTIDVDAMARAKDAGEPEAQSPSAPESVESSHESAPPTTEASPPPDESPATGAPSQGAEAPASTSNADASSATTMSAAPAAAATPKPPAPAVSGNTHAASPTDADSQAISIAAACESRATRLLDNVEKSAFDAATVDFDAQMRSALPAPKLKEAWDSLARFGTLNGRGQSHLGTAEGYTLVMIPLIFEKTNLVAQIACGSDGRIAGFHVSPAPKPQF